MILPVEVTIETDEPQSDPYVRWASLKLNGVTIFRDLVYDSTPDERTDEQAAQNLLRVFAHRLGKLEAL